MVDAGLRQDVGFGRSADRATDWGKAVGAKAELRGTAQASKAPHGFLAEAMRKGGGGAAEELAAR